MAAAVTCGAFLFYYATLAPTVLWGDDAFFQWSAVAGYLQPDGGGHWLHFTLSRLFVHLPVGDAAYRVNLLSAVFAALTIFFIYAAGLSLQLSNRAAASGALSLAVAHTFWTHAVRAEVYTVFTFMLALIFWLLAGWRKERPVYVFAALFLFGPTLLSHQMGLLFLPSLLLLLWLRRDRLHRNDWLPAATALLGGLALSAVVIQAQVREETLSASLNTYFTQSGVDFSGSIFNFSFWQFPADIAFWLAATGLQFIGAALLLGIFGFASRRKMTPEWLALIIFYLATVIFAATYRVNDRYVFFLPGYLVLALLVGRGWDRLAEIRPSLSKIVFPLLVLVPIITYNLLPTIMQRWNFSPLDARRLPGREPATFFLWPAKNGYTAAAEFGRSALTSLPQDSVLIADHTPYETLHYLQEVEGIRPDVRLVKIEPGQNLAPVIQSFSGNQAIFLADDNPTYYNLSSLQDMILVPTKQIFSLEFQ